MRVWHSEVLLQEIMAFKSAMVSTNGNSHSSASLRKDLSSGYYCGQEGWGKVACWSLGFLFEKDGHIFYLYLETVATECVYIYTGELGTIKLGQLY